MFCTTGGLTTKTFTPVPANLSTFYLVVPTNDHVEGSYGLGFGAAERSPSLWPCAAQQTIASCP